MVVFKKVEASVLQSRKDNISSYSSTVQRGQMVFAVGSQIDPEK